MDDKPMTLEQAELAVVSAERELQEALAVNKSANYKWPKYHWHGKARCFSCFDRKLSPSDISPRMSGFVSRPTLRSYYCQWLVLERIEKAKKKLAYAKMLYDFLRPMPAPGGEMVKPQLHDVTAGVS